MQPIAFSFTATPDLGPKALRLTLRRRGGRLGPAALVALPLLLALLALDAEARPFAFALGGAAIMLFVIFLLAVAMRRRQQRRFFAQAADRTVRVTMADDAVTVATALGSATLPWSQFERLWEDDELVLLFYGGWQRLVFPRAAIPADALALARQKIGSP